MDPRVTYDRHARALTVELEKGAVAGTVAFDEDHLVDLDAEGRVLSIEVLTPETPMIEEVAARFGIDAARVGMIVAAIDRAFAATAPETRTAAASFEEHGTVEKQVVVTGMGGGVSKGVSRSEQVQREIDLVP